MIWLVAWLSAAASFLILDLAWLKLAAPRAYRPLLGDLLAEKPRKLAALAFYLLYVSGMVWFAVRVGFFIEVEHAVLNGALLGLFAYGTWALTNLATLRGWPVRLVLLDMAWGASTTALASGISAWTLLKLGYNPFT